MCDNCKTILAIQCPCKDEECACNSDKPSHCYLCKHDPRPAGEAEALRSGSDGEILA